MTCQISLLYYLFFHFTFINVKCTRKSDQAGFLFFVIMFYYILNIILIAGGAYLRRVPMDEYAFRYCRSISKYKQQTNLIYNMNIINYNIANKLQINSAMSNHLRSQQMNEQENSNEQIKVYIRNRPLRNQFAKRCLKLIDHGVALNFKDKIFQMYFDEVFDQGASQQSVFKQTCAPLLDDVLHGNHASLFVYGQTGTGKTYTMGTLQSIKRQDQGLIPLSLNYLINNLKEKRPQKDWSISLSFMQIYMEDIYDLLNPRNQKLKIRQDHQFGQIYVEDLVIVPISNYKQSIDLINAGLQYRKTGNQRMNQLSSRSHTILNIYISQKISQNQYMSSTLSLIDLAGSQRVKKTNSTDLRLKQAKFINTSLSALGNVISELALNDSQRFIPYRSSKLTRILKNSLTGRSKISVICTLQISESNLYQTYSTLLFADRCKAIRFPNQPVISIQTFQQLDQQKDLKMALEKSKQKQQQYLQIIKNLQANGKAGSRQSQRQIQLSNIIESIYKLFGQINDHMKKLLQPQSKNDPKKQMPKVTSSTSIPSIKGQITKLAQQTIQRINNLSLVAFGEGKSSVNSYSGPQAQALLGLLLQNLRQNVKLQQSIFIKDGKQSLQKQIAIEQYEKEKKQQILNKLKQKKLNSLVNHLQEIWSQANSSINPLQSLLNNIRRSQVNYFAEKTQTNVATNNQFTSPKEFLKMLTRQQSQRKHKQIYIDDEMPDEQRSIAGSQIKYFKGKNSPVKKSGIRNQQYQKNEQKISKQSSGTVGNSQIKKLLQSLIVSKSMHEQKKRSRMAEDS